MNDSIKRVQSQAGLSFAERENRRSLAGGESNFRPQVKNKLLLLLVLLMTAATGAWADEVTEIVFTGTVTANALAADATFTVDGSTFSATIADGDNKMRIDADARRFGTSTSYKSYTHCLCSGGKSSSTKNYITLNIPEAGKLRIAPRTGSPTATDRKLVITQGETELYNEIVQESQAVTVTESGQNVTVYPYVEVDVTAGSVRVSYTGGMNFYSFGFVAASSGGGSGGDTKYTVTMAAEAGEGWTIAPAEATTTGVDKDTKITATYSGTKRVKSVTAVVKAAEPATPTLLEFEPGGKKFYYYEGETWKQAIDNHPENAANGWRIDEDDETVYNNNSELKGKDHDDEVYGNSLVDATISYIWYNH